MISIILISTKLQYHFSCSKLPKAISKSLSPTGRHYEIIIIIIINTLKFVNILNG